MPRIYNIQRTTVNTKNSEVKKEIPTNNAENTNSFCSYFKTVDLLSSGILRDHHPNY